MNLGVTVMAAGNAVSGPGCLNLFVFQPSVSQPLFFKSGLQKAAAAAAAVVVGAVGLHIDKILFTDNRFDHETQILGDGIAIAFAHDLAWVLNRELDLPVFVPVGIDLQFAFANPFGVIFIYVLDFEVVFDVEFFQSSPD
jgi:hypothetical protein